MSNYAIKNNILSYFVDKTIYSKETIFKCVYWLAADFTVNISEYDDKRYLIEITHPNPPENWETLISSVLHKLERDLIDYSLREIVDKETRTIKELIIAKAFAPFDVIHNDSKK